MDPARKSKPAPTDEPAYLAEIPHEERASVGEPSGVDPEAVVAWLLGEGPEPEPAD